jgi:hypothetical protein
MNDSSFVDDLRFRWKSVRKTSLRQWHVDGLVDSIANLLGEASQRHFQQ